MKAYGRRLSMALFALAALLAFPLFSLALTPMPQTNLSIGSGGSDVILLQDNLIELNLLDKSHADGEYNAFTIIAVRKLQQLLNLPVDGRFSSSVAVAFNEYIDKQSVSDKPLEGVIIGIDPGHQSVADNNYEPVSPGSKRTKERMTLGCIGTKSGVYEYEIVLTISGKLKKLLEDAGATVIMTRTSHDVSLSNIDRAKLINKAEVDCWVRVHCDFSSKRTTNGAYALSPSKTLTPDIYEESLELSKSILTEFCKSTGAKRNSVLVKTDQTGMNWSDYPVSTIEMGYLSNISEDQLLNNDRYQTLCAQGIYNGLTAYFKAN